MKRHPILQPLSRQHHTLLLAVLLLQKGIKKGASLGTMQQFLQQVWRSEIVAYFQKEQVLLHQINKNGSHQEIVARIEEEHKTLEQAYQLSLEGGANELEMFCSMLHQHIRTTERQYYPVLEITLADLPIPSIESEEKIDGKSCLQFEPKFWE